MDESKKAEEYIKYGHWPGKKVRLTSKQWEGQINHALSLIRDYIKSMSGFVPIHSLINVKKENRQLITPEEVIFSEGIDLNTHCHIVCENYEPWNPGSEADKDLFSRHVMLITRKMEWIGWNNYFKSEITFDEKRKPVFRKDTSFRSSLFISDLKIALKWDASFGRQFIEHVRLWLVGDIYQEQERIRQKERVLSEVSGIAERIKEAVEY